MNNIYSTNAFAFVLCYVACVCFTELFSKENQTVQKL